MDPHILASIFSEEHVEQMWFEPEPRSGEIEQMRSLAEKLPSKLKSLYTLLIVEQKTQEEAAKELGITQATVSHRYSKVVEMLKWLKNTPAVSPKELEANLRLMKPEWRPVMELYLGLTPLVEIGEALGVSYFFARKVIQQEMSFTPKFKELLAHLRARPILNRRKNNG